MQLTDYLEELKRIRLLKPDEEKKLWTAYKEQGDDGARRRLIESYQPLVFKQVMPYRSYEGIMDLIQEGTVGLIEAVESFCPTRGVAFSLYASHRIRGRIYDYLRQEGQSDIACMDAQIGQETGGISLKEQLPATDATVPEQAETHELIGRVRAAMARLPQKERAVLQGVYLECQTAQAVADTLEVTPSHVYRLEKSGVRRVRGMLSRFMHHW